MRLISSPSAAISSSRRALFDLKESLLRIFSNTFSTGSLVVLPIIEPRGTKEALFSDYHPTAFNCWRIEFRMIAPDSSLGQASRRTHILCQQFCQESSIERHTAD